MQDRLNDRLQGTMKTLLIGLVLLSFSVYGWDNLDKEFSTLNIDVRYMWSGGAWEDEGKKGFYRILVAGGGYEHYKSKMYVQWVEHGSDMEAPKILVTTEIQELNENPLYAFKLPICIGDWECRSIKINATHTYEFTKHIFIIKFVGIGKYAFAPMVR